MTTDGDESSEVPGLEPSVFTLLKAIHLMLCEAREEAERGPDRIGKIESQFRALCRVLQVDPEEL